MQAIMAYYHWISQGIPIYADVPWLGLEPLQSSHKPDIANGKQVFKRCQKCHGDNGHGTAMAPPLWGPQSFNDGAGMHRLHTFAAFVHAFMPFANPDLSVDQALDLAAYVTSQERPHFSPPKANSGK
jgi:thiosulfate dehydrogenase